MGLFKKIDASLDNANLKGIVADMPVHGYGGIVELIPSDYTNDGHLMARAQVMGPFHVDLASIGDKYFCFIALGADGEWSAVGERNVFELNLSTAWSRNSTITKAFIQTIAEVRSMAEAYFKMEAEGFSLDDSVTSSDSELEEDNDEDFDWAEFAVGQEVVTVPPPSPTDEDDGENIPLDEALRLIDGEMSELWDEVFSLPNFKALVKATQEIFKEREIDIFLKVGNKNLDAMFPEQTTKASVSGLEDGFFFADRAHWAYYDPNRKGKPYKTTQIALLEGPEMFALYVSYFFLMRAIGSFATEEGRKAAEKNNLSLGLITPILSFFKEIKAENNDTTSLAANAYLDGWQEIVDKYS